MGWAGLSPVVLGIGEPTQGDRVSEILRVPMWATLRVGTTMPSLHSWVGLDTWDVSQAGRRDLSQASLFLCCMYVGVRENKVSKPPSPPLMYNEILHIGCALRKLALRKLDEHAGIQNTATKGCSDDRVLFFLSLRFF